MKNISKFNYCFGCGVCAVACPKKAISMQVNEDGFYSPIIDKQTCVECGICLDVCAFNHSTVCQDAFEPVSTAAWSRNIETRFQCTSGGTAFEIEKKMLKSGYKICGVRYDIKAVMAEHIIVSDEDSLRETIGSKYIQSNTCVAFSQFKKDEKYFVIGTPCQIDSLRRWIRKKKWEDNFILMDFFCHSVPSMLMWKKYLEYVGIKEPEVVQFRNKRNGWQDSDSICIKCKGQEWFSPLSKGDLFYAFFLGDRCPNECCVKECKYKQQNSAADLRIGDLWGYKYINNKDGVNALVAFTPIGAQIISNLGEECVLEPCNFNTVAELQMKENCVPKRSWRYVRKALKSNKTLPQISKMAWWIELPDTYPSVIRQLVKFLLIKLRIL